MADLGVVIVDDSDEWLRRLESAVQEVPSLAVVGTAATPTAAIDLVSTLRPPILVLDLGLSGGSGIDVLKALGNQNIQTRPVVITGSPSASLRTICMQLGARYFLDKAFEFEELQPALRELQEEATKSNL